jgi:hypothetical protein
MKKIRWKIGLIGQNGVVGKGYENPYGQGRIVAVEEPAQ